MTPYTRVLFLLVSLFTVSCNWAQMGGSRVDAKLVSMIPADTVGLAGIRMDDLRPSPLYQKLLSQQRLTMFDDLAARTGFDPRKDVRELLIASNGRDDALILARGTFHIRAPAEFKKTTYQGYTLYTSEHGGVGLIDESTAVAGRIPTVRAALDQFKSGKSSADPDLLARARAIGPENQIWSVSKGFGGILNRALPESGNAANLDKILRALENATAAVDLRSGVKGYATGLCRTEQDAKSLGDAARGLVGMGRLSVPDNQPQMLRLWDGIKIEQQQRTVRINVAIPQELVDKLVEMLGSGQGMRKMGRF
jgi:hypothetical protein